MRTYIVQGYANQKAFDHLQFSIIVNGITRRADALRIGRKALKQFPIVKMRTADGEWDEVLRSAAAEPVKAITLNIQEDAHVFNMGQGFGTREGGAVCTLCGEVNTHRIHLRTVALLDTDLAQIIDGLTARAESWEATAEYLSPDQVQPENGLVEECSSEHEARQIAQHYREIISKLERARTV